ncbi:hypothetical protein XELAEV_18032444mg [Xenopus laevis]|uniref:Fucolectin tachylectin-4 pentraxin-1 domain-containing protein n=1 Tax=Xenopus laevis TaxID=8355 RepID=A0A974CPH8_XENLA|nr:hypothetical protein XELAEV_18032444mg [Xenopus laevis]
MIRSHWTQMKCVLVLLAGVVVGWAQRCGPQPGDTNLARLGKATQSSDYRPEYVAQTVIDGVKETSPLIRPCSHTNYDKPAWWQVDLRKRYKIETVVIVNREDCCSERLLAAEIRVGDSADNNNPVCDRIMDVSKVTITLFCKGMEGRYVSVVIPGRKEHLTLCELEVYGEESTKETAVNDIEMSHLFINSCAHTNNYNLTWWTLDLKKRYKVQKVVIVNRMDEHKERLLGAEIHVGDSVDINNPVCGTITNVSVDNITLLCDGKVGFYVIVVIPHSSEFLQLSEVEVYGDTSADHKGVNLARQGAVKQSSSFLSIQSADTAIDGVKLDDLSLHPCAHTSDDNPSWWRLDLKSRFEVDCVFIVYRMDDKRERLLGAEVRIGDSEDNNNPVCGTITDVSQGTVTLSCKGMEGRYVSVVIPGRKEYLTLCEVEVYGEKLNDHAGLNLAKLGEVDQSSTYLSTYPAEAAVDGIKVTDLLIHPCAHTNKDNPAWWQLDLKKRYKVKTVIIVNRMDEHSERLLGAEIRVGNSPDNNNPVCGTITIGTEAIIILSCGGMEGRYVSVVIPGREEYLQLCEVEVYGEESTGYKDNLARSGDVKQSSTYRQKYRTAATVDGVKRTKSLIHPCTPTKHDNPAWWQLDLKKRYNVQTVLIINRMDEHSERLLGAEIRVGDLANNNNPVCRNITDVSQANITLYCNGMEGRYVSVVIPGRRQYLQLCEVEVYGEESINQEGINLARSGEVRQSSTRSPQNGAERAIDGNKDTNNYSQPCTQTKRDSPAWWRLDLMRTYRIGAILIVSRGDRLIGAEIRVGDSLKKDNPLCATITEIFQDATTVYCYGMEGRYITVLISGDLSLCEVEVYGHQPYTSQ